MKMKEQSLLLGDTANSISDFKFIIFVVIDD